MKFTFGCSIEIIHTQLGRVALTPNLPDRQSDISYEMGEDKVPTLNPLL